MSDGVLQWGNLSWQPVAGVLGVVALAAVVLAYARARHRSPTLWVAAAVKLLVFALLLLCLLDPLWVREQAKPGENLFVVLADNSRSLQLFDPGAVKSRGETVRDRLLDAPRWQRELANQFVLRQYGFDRTLKTMDSLAELNFEGEQSQINETLRSLPDRFRHRPIAGVLLLTDGVATDAPLTAEELERLPPVYTVVAGTEQGLSDLSVGDVSVSQTNFEAAPISLQADITAEGTREPVRVEVRDDQGKTLARQTVQLAAGQTRATVRFQVTPEKAGILFYEVRVVPELKPDLLEEPGRSVEATLENNRQLVMVDRGGGPYRVLYVAGRPNWEFKFLRRSLEEDHEVKLVGLMRVARKEPKFDFRSRENESTNPLYRGFGNEEDEDAEQYDQPVLIRLGVTSPEELRDGFPKSRRELFQYHAVILDDIESSFFTQDQMSLIQEFVSQRGGGFLMLGGQESFSRGGFDRTPIGEMLPVYVARDLPFSGREQFRFDLSREGWLEPWLRLRPTEIAERRRLDEVPPLVAVNAVPTVKPGASILATMSATDGQKLPGVVAQSFGKGRSVAMLPGDFWRWGMHRETGMPRDMEAAWRQAIRWLVADVPQRIEPWIRPLPTRDSYRLEVDVWDEEYQPQVNAVVRLEIHSPDEKKYELEAEPSDSRAGRYEVEFSGAEPGAYRGTVRAVGPDGRVVAQREIGWTHQPNRAEFMDLAPQRDWLEQLAEQTGGQAVALDDINRWAANLPASKIPVTERQATPLWHHWWVLTLALAGLALEWTLRRRNGAP